MRRPLMASAAGSPRSGAGQRPPHPVERLRGGGPKRRHIDRRAGELAQPVVGGGVEAHDFGVMLEQRDERQEQAAIQAVAIEFVGRHVGGRDQHQPGREQALEQARQDHRVGDVLDLELVEAEQSHLAGDRRGHRRDRIATASLARNVNPLVGLGHEFVEMDAALGDGGGDREEFVHQHGLATADLAVDVEAARGAPASTEEPRKQTAAASRGVVGKGAIEGFKPTDDGRLRRVGAERPGRDEVTIAVGERGLPRARLGHLFGSRSRRWRSSPLGSRWRRRRFSPLAWFPVAPAALPASCVLFRSGSGDVRAQR